MGRILYKISDTRLNNFHVIFSSSLHGPKLTGQKLLAYHLENRPESGLDSDTLLHRLKAIRSRAGCKVEDILMTALTNSFGNHFKKVRQLGNFLKHKNHFNN